MLMYSQRQLFGDKDNLIHKDSRSTAKIIDSIGKLMSTKINAIFYLNPICNVLL